MVLKGPLVAAEPTWTKDWLTSQVGPEQASVHCLSDNSDQGPVSQYTQRTGDLLVVNPA
jgi:hypothetical protein